MISAPSKIDGRTLFLVNTLENVVKTSFPMRDINLLDIGCSDCSFINEAKKVLSVKSNISGVDVQSKWNNGLGKNGSVFVQDLQEGIGDIPQNYYQIISMWDVIEHIENIPKFMENVRKLLTDGGVLLICTPNLFGITRFLKGKDWIGVLEEDHKYLFDSLSISMVLRYSGFKNINVKSYLFPKMGNSLFWLNEITSKLGVGGMLFVQAKK